jgi:hypothetical protein
LKIAMTLMVLMALGQREKADCLLRNNPYGQQLCDTAEAMVIRQGRIVARSAAMLRQHKPPWRGLPWQTGFSGIYRQPLPYFIMA